MNAPDPNSRQYRLRPPTTWLQKALIKSKDAGEAWIASHSIHEDLPVYPAEWFPWTAKLEDNWQVMRKELDQLLARRRDMPDFHQILEPVKTITQDDDWKTFFLIAPGMDCTANQEQCPETTKLLGQVPDIRTAMFSILSPGKHIPPHRGAYNGLLRYHLGLKVPEPHEKCRIRIADKTTVWREGQSLVFDDTFNHEVWNDTEGVRVVLFVDFLRPMKKPYDAINRSLVQLGSLTPQMRKANRQQQEWTKQFYREK